MTTRRSWFRFGRHSNGLLGWGTLEEANIYANLLAQKDGVFFVEELTPSEIDMLCDMTAGEIGFYIDDAIESWYAIMDRN